MTSRSKVAVVTGANKGLGYHIARGLLLKGFAVVLACRDGDRAAAAVQKLLADAEVSKHAPGGQPTMATVTFDLEQPATLTEAETEVRKLFPEGIDVIVHNAGFAFKTDATEDFGVQADKTTAINFFNTIKASEAFLPLVKDGGRVVFMSSRAGYLSFIPKQEIREAFVRRGVTVADVQSKIAEFVALAKEGKHKDAGWTNNAYGTSKIGLSAYARLLAMDPAVRARGITVNWCCPGWCRTDMAGDDAPKSAEEGADTPVWLASSSEVDGITGRFFGERQELDWVNGVHD